MGRYIGGVSTGRVQPVAPVHKPVTRKQGTHAPHPFKAVLDKALCKDK